MKNDIQTHFTRLIPANWKVCTEPIRDNSARSFRFLYPQLKGKPLADFWNERLSYESGEISWGTGRELLFVITLLPHCRAYCKDTPACRDRSRFFYPRNISFIVFPALTAYFAWKQNLPDKEIDLCYYCFCDFGHLH
jgi:hypothetical protein